jgi:hypothetical protein
MKTGQMPEYTSSQLSVQYRIAMDSLLAGRLAAGLTEFGYSFLTSCTEYPRQTRPACHPASLQLCTRLDRTI